MGRNHHPSSTFDNTNSSCSIESWSFGSGPCIIICLLVLLRRGGFASDWRKEIQKDRISFDVRLNQIDLMSFDIRLNLCDLRSTAA